MTARGDGILAWLNSAISNRERMAREAASEAGGSWREDPFVYGVRDEKNVMVARSREERGASIVHIAVNDPESVLRRCAADRKAVALYVETVAIRDRSAASIQAAQGSGIRPDPCVLDDWSRANREATFMLPLIQILAEGYGWTGGER